MLGFHIASVLERLSKVSGASLCVGPISDMQSTLSHQTVSCLVGSNLDTARSSALLAMWKLYHQLFGTAGDGVVRQLSQTLCNQAMEEPSAAVTTRCTQPLMHTSACMWIQHHSACLLQASLAVLRCGASSTSTASRHDGSCGACLHELLSMHHDVCTVGERTPSVGLLCLWCIQCCGDRV